MLRLTLKTKPPPLLAEALGKMSVTQVQSNFLR
jgi:hypothetical protein